MELVQLAISDARYCEALRELLERSGTRVIQCVKIPDSRQEGVIVVDSATLGALPLPLSNPERVVLITHNDPRFLTQAWEAGIRSVVFQQDSLNTAVLAIMAAELRHARPAGSGRKPSSAQTVEGSHHCCRRLRDDSEAPKSPEPRPHEPNRERRG